VFTYVGTIRVNGTWSTTTTTLTTTGTVTSTSSSSFVDAGCLPDANATCPVCAPDDQSACTLGCSQVYLGCSYDCFYGGGYNRGADCVNGVWSVQTYLSPCTEEPADAGIVTTVNCPFH
jgi:hypothetical protein